MYSLPPNFKNDADFAIIEAVGMMMDDDVLCSDEVCW